MLKKNIRIDSHQHIWQLSRGDYEWLTPDLKGLYKDFLPDDLLIHLNQCQIEGSILIQAAPTLDETFFLLENANQYPFILGVVGWIDMLSTDATDILITLAKHPKFCGIRPMLQDISDINWVLQKELDPVFKSLSALQVTFDALVKPAHLTNLIRLVEQYPNLKITLDHAGKPLIKENIFEPWGNQIKTLAEFPNVYCKLSGILTEAGQNWTRDQILPYIDHLFNTFGPNRLMWGSDFPVINLVSSYEIWYKFCEDYVKTHYPDAEFAVFGDTARQFYCEKRDIV